MIVVNPLRKCKLTGELYRRLPEIESKLSELLQLPEETLVERSLINDKTSVQFVPIECLVHIVRNVRGRASKKSYERLYKILMGRVLKLIPKRATRGDLDSVTNTEVKSQILGQFAELIANDCLEYNDKLDFYEVRFLSAFSTLKTDAIRKVTKGFTKQESMEVEESGGIIKPEVEYAVDGYNPFDVHISSVSDYQIYLDSAIDTLPDLQKRIMQLMKLGMPIDSKDPNTESISATLGKSEKTIRTHRNKAFAALKKKLTGGDL
ncbi:sigma-70 family RNA polymerase sigma factor [Vibrio sp. SM6]|uniref:Sigma-70 family RNA polymerase sigma factor n=1 Tax=Vibrio agarilyticus TaxID=2726741 RepID=A0A7X8TU04_9VIBR|nr:MULTISPECIES: sigma-70 family RNA polymerase sigma factor [Vibrio]NLS14892.1 sigma-70 family RNA polymerase sigma factor [Vibrio agarilyticus]HDY7423096.1 sigma-70 family RNA polymerase sigma factor [Vibrio vulnificus]HDY7496765.1 sigma-70 family RNA polymerase sigma factor [Vibrio vulnificus]HDY7999264.1 sigma-70 family RNA polymerase sigma factor [Vibrio vulnificus]